jgi:outer membrane receptor protein involved in Fe transport
MKLRIPTLTFSTAAVLLVLSFSPGFGQTAPAASGGGGDTVKLDPFSVTADSDVGFVAASSLAGGRIATPLKDTPVAYSVITKEFLEAFNITNIADSGSWSVNTDYTPGDQTDLGYGTGPNRRVRIRGISANTPTRNFFPFAGGATDSFDIDRVDYARGANAVLFGAGGAGGTQNTGTKQALTSRSFQEATVQVGSWNKYRMTADLNQVVNEKFAFRTNLMIGSSDSWRKRIWEDKKGLHLAATYRVSSKFTLRGEFEITSTRKSHAVAQYNEYVSAWDGQTYDFSAPLTGAGAPTPAFLAKAGIERFAGRFVARPDYNGRFLNWKNSFRTKGASYNTNPTLTNWVNTAQGRVPIGTVNYNLNGQAMTDSRIGLDDNTRYGLVLGGSPFFSLPTPEDNGLWDDPAHKYPLWAQVTKDLSLYANYAPFDGFFVELAGNANRAPVQASNAARRGLREYRLDISRNLPDGSPNPYFLHGYQDHAEYFQQRGDDFENIRLQSAYVKDTRFGKLQLGIMGGINNEIIKNRSSVIVLPADWILPDARYWVNNGEMNEFFPYQRLYADETNRGWATPYNSLNTKPSIAVDPTTGISKAVTPFWMYDARREDNVYDARRDYKFAQAAGNLDLFKNRLVLIAAFRRDATHFSQNRIKAPGDMPDGWNGLDLTLRPSAPTDYQTLTYFPKNAAGVVTGPERPADARPRTQIAGVGFPVAQYTKDRFRDDFDSPDVDVSVNTHTLGAVVNVTRWLGVFANRSKTFNFNSPQQDIYNNILAPTSATSDDAGIRVTLPNNKLSASLAWFRAYQAGAITSIGFGFIDNYNSIGDLGKVGDLFNRNVRDFRRFRLNNIGTTVTNDTRGYELELTGNPMPNWRIIFNASKTDAAQIDSSLDAVGFFGENDALMRSILADGGIVIDPATNLAFINPALDDPTKINQVNAQAAVSGWNNLQSSTIPQMTALSKLRANTLGSSEYMANLATDYRFRRGKLNGLRVGIGLNYRGGAVAGNKSLDTIRSATNPAVAVDDPTVNAADDVIGDSYITTTGTLSYTLTLKDSRRFLPKRIQFDLAVSNLLNKTAPIYGYSTGSQNTSETVFVPRDGTLSDPSRRSVGGNFFYLDPRNFTLTAKMDF